MVHGGRAISCPQWHFYGGNGKVETSLQVLHAWLQEEFIPHNNNYYYNNAMLVVTSVEASGAHQVPEKTFKITTMDATNTSTTNTMPIHHAVTWIDIHMGLGPFGIDTLLMKLWHDKQEALQAKQQQQDEPQNSPDEAAKAIARKHFESFANELDLWFPGSHHPFQNKASCQISQGYENVRGFMGEYFPKVFLVNQQTTIHIITQEFGTFKTLWVALALILENVAYQHLPPAKA